jgi:hypothetical protein
VDYLQIGRVFYYTSCVSGFATEILVFVGIVFRVSCLSCMLAIFILYDREMMGSCGFTIYDIICIHASFVSYFGFYTQSSDCFKFSNNCSL